MSDIIILVVVIIVIYLYATGAYASAYKYICAFIQKCASACDLRAPKNADDVPPPEEPPAGTGENNQGTSRESKAENLERRMISENIESQSEVVPSSCSGKFAQDEYGAPGIEFADWVMNQTVDARVIASNKQFVADRMGNPQTWTGATRSPDRHDSYDAVPWRGLSRPARVAVDAPDQLPDIDTDKNPTEKKFRWASGETD